MITVMIKRPVLLCLLAVLAVGGQFALMRMRPVRSAPVLSEGVMAAVLILTAGV